MNLVILKLFGAQRLERAESHIQSDLHNLDPTRPQPLQNRRREMQPRGGRRDGAALPRKNRLIPLAIGWLVLALDVGRQRNVPQTLDRFRKAAIRSKSQHAQPEFAAILDRRLELAAVALAKSNALAHRHLPPRPDQRFPRV